ncbi:hypothetical protein NQ176_g5373 [Zarea fungicola]|uniref:Uncharacterized protein n=1 Tax=Zarea fungicola TaxID=93591 RepID=A0ACC1N8V2_9HYPO|nr:hypothetical protein NQ176_g5373 [Lecanicillium fungicola]
MLHASMEEGASLHLASSAISGFVVCCFMHPPGEHVNFIDEIEIKAKADYLDTVMSRLYNQQGNLYKGVFDCFLKTVRTEGIFAMYKGFLPHLARILPHTILTLSLAEQTSRVLRKVEGRLMPVLDTDQL